MSRLHTDLSNFLQKDFTLKYKSYILKKCKDYTCISFVFRLSFIRSMSYTDKIYKINDSMKKNLLNQINKFHKMQFKYCNYKHFITIILA